MGVVSSISRREPLGSKSPEDPRVYTYRHGHEHPLRGALRVTFFLSLALSVVCLLFPWSLSAALGAFRMRLNDLAEMAGLIIGAIGVVSAVPTSFPASGNVMWYTAPGTGAYTPTHSENR